MIHMFSIVLIAALCEVSYIRIERNITRCAKWFLFLHIYKDDVIVIDISNLELFENAINEDFRRIYISKYVYFSLNYYIYILTLCFLDATVTFKKHNVKYTLYSYNIKNMQ